MCYVRSTHELPNDENEMIGDPVPWSLFAAILIRVNRISKYKHFSQTSRLILNSRKWTSEREVQCPSYFIRRRKHTV